MALTDLAIRNAKPKEKPYKLTDGRGMYLEVTPSGGRHWRLKYRFHGKENRISLGSYPETTLAEARDKLHAARKLLDNDIDPSAKRQADKRQAIEESQNTFEAVARLWFAHKSKDLSNRYTKFMWGRVEKDLFPPLGRKPINSITSQDIIATLQRVEPRHPDLAFRRCLVDLR